MGRVRWHLAMAAAALLVVALPSYANQPGAAYASTTWANAVWPALRYADAIGVLGSKHTDTVLGYQTDDRAVPTESKYATTGRLVASYLLLAEPEKVEAYALEHKLDGFDAAAFRTITSNAANSFSADLLSLDREMTLDFLKRGVVRSTRAHAVEGMLREMRDALHMHNAALLRADAEKIDVGSAQSACQTMARKYFPMLSNDDASALCHNTRAKQRDRSKTANAALNKIGPNARAWARWKCVSRTFKVLNRTSTGQVIYLHRAIPCRLDNGVLFTVELP